MAGDGAAPAEACDRRDAGVCHSIPVRQSRPPVYRRVQLSAKALYAALARSEGPHLLFVGQLGRTEHNAAGPFEVAAAGTMPHSRFSSRSRAVHVHGVHHMPDFRILHRGCHENILRL